MGVGDHRDLSPHAARALQHPLDRGLERPLLAAVLGRHLHQRRADACLVDSVAVETVTLPHPLESRGHRGGPAVDHPTGLDRGPRDVRRQQFLEAFGVGRRRVVRAVLVVADQESEVDRRCRVEEIAVRRLGKPDFGAGIADDHRHRRALLGSRRVANDQFDGVNTRCAEGERGMGFAGGDLGGRRGGIGLPRGRRWLSLSLGSANDPPLVIEGVAILVERSRARELHRERMTADVVLGGCHGHRRPVAADIVDPHQPGVGIHPPGVAILEEVEGSIGTELEVDRPRERPIGEEGFDAGDLLLVIESHDLDPVARPFVDEQAVVVVGGEAGRRIGVVGSVVDRPGTGRPPPFPELRECGRGAVGIPEKRRTGRGKDARSGVVWRGVDRRGRVEERADGRGGVVVVGVGEVVADEVGPAEIARPLRLVDLVVAARAARPFATGVGPDLPPVDRAGLRIDRHPPRVAAAHAVDLRPTGRAVAGEEIPCRDLHAAVGAGADAEDLAAQRRGIGR